VTIGNSKGVDYSDYWK